MSPDRREKSHSPVAVTVNSHIPPCSNDPECAQLTHVSVLVFTIHSSAHYFALCMKHRNGQRLRFPTSVSTCNRPLPSPNTTPGLDRHDASPYVALPVRVKSLTVPSGTGQAPEVQHVSEDASLEDHSFALLVLDLLPDAGLSKVCIELEKLAAKEDGRVFMTQLR
jgi:hypothetical protein